MEQLSTKTKQIYVLFSLCIQEKQVELKRLSYKIEQRMNLIDLLDFFLDISICFKLSECLFVGR